MNTRHFDLTRTQEYLDRIQEMEELGQVYGEETILVPISLDIKEMYTNLPHGKILDALHYVVAQMRAAKRSRTEHVRVPNDREERVGFGKSLNTIESKHITFKQMMELSEYDLRNTVFTVGTIMLKQEKGAPIGGYLSTVYAVAVCIKHENEFIESLGADAKYLSLMRYIDDITGAIAITMSDEESQVRARRTYTKLLRECYPSELDLKPEQIQDGNVRFLETITKYGDNDVEVRHLNKNYETIMNEGEQTFLTVQHCRSYSSKTSKRGVIMSRMQIISQNCTTESGRFRAVAEFLTEMRILAYSKRFLRQACRGMYDKTDDGFWLLVSRLVLL